MRRYNVFYFIGQAFSGFWRNGVMSVASVAVLMSLLVVIGGFSLLVQNIDLNLKSFGELNEVVVFVDTDATEEEILAVGDRIRRLENISSVRRVTKAEGLEEMKAKYDYYGDVTEENNPLPDSFVITFEDPEKVPELDYNLEAFTTRFDTVFGITFIALAPEHELVKKMMEHMPQDEESEEFADWAERHEELEDLYDEAMERLEDLQG